MVVADAFCTLCRRGAQYLPLQTCCVLSITDGLLWIDDSQLSLNVHPLCGHHALLDHAGQQIQQCQVSWGDPCSASSA